MHNVAIGCTQLCFVRLDVRFTYVFLAFMASNLFEFLSYADDTKNQAHKNGNTDNSVEINIKVCT